MMMMMMMMMMLMMMMMFEAGNELIPLPSTLSTLLRLMGSSQCWILSEAALEARWQATQNDLRLSSC